MDYETAVISALEAMTSRQQNIELILLWLVGVSGVFVALSLALVFAGGWKH